MQKQRYWISPQSVMVIVSSTVKYIYLSYTDLDKAGEAKVLEDMLFMIQK